MFFIAVFLLLLLLLFPGLCTAGAKDGLLLWFNTIIPTLFPFILVTNIIRICNGFPVFERFFGPFFKFVFRTGNGGSYPAVIGFLCGYPMGAKVVCDSYSCRRISKDEAEYLLSFTNNPSPVYVISYVSMHIFGRTDLAYLLFGVIFLTSLIVSAAYRFLHLKQKNNMCDDVIYSAEVCTHQDNGIFDGCIMKAFDLLVRVGGYMILFSILSRCLCAVPFLPSWVCCILGGLLEQTTGLALLKQQNMPLKIKTALTMAFICFGGLSITAQTCSVIHPHGLSFKKYIFCKIFAGITAGLLTLLFYSIFEQMTLW